MPSPLPPLASLPPLPPLTERAEAAPAAECAADHWAEDSLHYRAVLRRIVDLGAGIAEKLSQQIDPEAPPAQAAETSVAFDRIARTLRRTVALARILGTQSANAPAKPARLRLETRHRIIRGVEDVIRENLTGDMAENFRDDLYTRLDDPDFDDTVDDRQIPDIVAAICRSLGIDVTHGPEPWKYTPDEELEALAARATRPRTKRVREGPTDQ